MNTTLIFHQLFEASTSTYTYLLADEKTREAVLIDPVLETSDRDLQWLKELDLKLTYVLDTHVHADHITGAARLREKTGAKTCVSHRAQVECADLSLKEGQEIPFGQYRIKVLETPGHTNSCLSFLLDGMVFTGDALLIRGTGRTDFQQGSAQTLYSSITEKLFTLPDNTIVYPGHDYQGYTKSSIALEKKFNPRLARGKSREEFVKIMSELKLQNPKNMHFAVPANLKCGVRQDARHLNAQTVDGIPVVQSEDVFENIGRVEIIDVRRPEEFSNELGHIKTAKLFTLGQELTSYLESGDKNREIVFVCRSGGRSAQATEQALRLGFKAVANMSGGMLDWNEKKLEKEF